MSLEDAILFFQKTSSIENIVLGIAGSLVLIGFQQAFKLITRNVSFLAANLSKSFSLNGYWVSITFHEQEPDKLKYFDLMEIKHRSADIDIIIWHYGSMYENKNWYKYYGRGVQKGQNISLYYYLASKDYPETGCYILHLEGAKLVGPYVQYTVNDKDSHLKISDKQYSLRRSNLPWKKKLRLFFAKPPFKDFEEARAFSDRAGIYYD